MKLALCLEYPIDQFGGTEVLVQELIKGLAAQHQIVLVSNESDESAKKSSIGHLISEHISWDPTLISAERSRQLAESLARSKVELAHFHLGGNFGWNVRAFSKSPIVGVQQAGIPCLSTNHGAFAITDGYCGPQRSFLKVALFLPAWLSKQYVLSKLLCEVTVSQNDFRSVRKWYPLMRRKFRQIYHSRIHEASSTPVQSRRRKVILCVGTVGPRKGQWILTDAFAKIAAKYPEWQLVLVGRMGDDPLSQRVRNTIAREKIGAQTQLLGTRSDKEVEQWLCEAAIFAMPSFQEGLGLSLQEALFYGCACVGSRIGGIPDLIDEGENGLLVEVGNVDQLAAVLELVMADDGLRARLSARTRQSILDKEMTAEKMVAKYQALYGELSKNT
ncbi:MAG: glycosyltransferase family 4 protein [Verrucomicrobiota bacterium]